MGLISLWVAFGRGGVIVTSFSMNNELPFCGIDDYAAILSTHSKYGFKCVTVFPPLSTHNGSAFIIFLYNASQGWTDDFTSGLQAGLFYISINVIIRRNISSYSLAHYQHIAYQLDIQNYPSSVNLLRLFSAVLQVEFARFCALFKLSFAAC
jgi:hypothetical protein